MKHLFIFGLLSIGSSLAFQPVEMKAAPKGLQESSAQPDGITAKVFQVKFKDSVEKQKTLSKIKNQEGIMHYYSEGQYNNLLIVIAQPWLSQEGLLQILKTATNGNFIIIGEQIKTLDQGYLSK